MPSNKSNVQASASEERIVDDLCGDARGKDPSVARLLAGFNQLRSTLGEVGSEADRRLALVSANLDSAVMRFSPEIATRIAEGVTMFHTAFSRTQGQLHLGEP